MLAVDVLEEAGFDALEARDADEAVKVLGEHPEVRLLFTDIDMPGRMNGLALAEQVHSDRPDIEIIVTSGKRRLDDAAIPDDGHFLAKPYASRELLDLLKKKLS